MTPTITIETLQKDVDQVTTDLADLKKLTDESLKQSKAEKIESAVVIAKEAITAKIEVLKELTDAKSKADLVQLEAMLVTLEDSDELKTAIVTPTVPKVDIPDVVVEGIDNSADLATIKANIVDMTAMSSELKKLVDAYKVAKKTGTDMEKDIEEKKAALIAKRTETQELIDKVRSVWKELKINDMDESVQKTTLEKLQIADEKVLVENQKELDNIEIPGSTFFEKVGDITKKGWRKVGEGAEKTWEWAKRNPGRAIAGTLGIAGLIRGISKLLKKKKPSESSEEKDDEGSEDKTKKKGFRDKWYGKALKWGLIGTGLWFVGKGLFTGKWPRSDKDGTGADVSDALSSTKASAESFKELLKDDPAKAEKLNNVGDDVNDLYDEVYKFNDATMPTGVTEAKLGKGEEKYAGAIPHILDNTFKNIDDMEGQRGLFVLCAYGDIAEVKKAFAGLIAKGCSKLVSGVLSMFGVSGLVDASNVETKVDEFLGGTNTIDDMHMVFRKILKVMSYTNYLENAYLAKDIAAEVKKGKPLYKKDGDVYATIVFPTDAEEIKTLISDMQYNPSDYKIGDVEISTLRKDFRSKNLAEISKYEMTTEEILAYNYDIMKDIKSINDDRDETLKNLEKDQIGTLEKLEAGAADEMADGFWESNKKLFPFLHITEIVSDETAVKAKIKEDAGFKKMLADFTAKFKTLRTEKDKTKVKASIDDYYATLKELYTTQNSIVDMTDKNGDIVTTAVTAFTSAFTGTAYCFTHGAKLMYEGNIITGAAYIYGGCATVALVGKLTGLSNASGIVGLGFKLNTVVAKLPFQIINAVLPKNLMLSNVTNIIPTVFAKQRYNTVPKIIDGLGRGLSYEKAYSLYNAIGTSTEKTRSFFTEVLSLETREAAFISRMESIVFKDGKITSVGKEFLDEAFTRPGVFSTKKVLEVTGDLEGLVSKYETTIQSTAETEAALSKIATVAKSTESLGDLTTLASEYTSLLAKGDSVDGLALKILKQWGAADGDVAMYLTTDAQIARAKVYAEEVMKLQEGTVETSKIGEAWNSAKTMFKEGMEKIKNLFTKTASPEMSAALEKSMTQAEVDVAKISDKTYEAAVANPASKEGETVANVVQGKIGLRSRILKRSPLLIDGIFNIFKGRSLMNEAAEIEKINVERASVREEKATFTLVLGGAEIIMFAVGVAMSWNPAGRVILAITAGIETLKYGVNQYYEVVETYYRNFEDFKRMYMSHIKQEIISKEARGDGIDISLQENFQEAVSAVFGSQCHGTEKKVLSLKTREDAIRALIWMEECENYPYATLNLDSFKGTEYTALQAEVNKESDAMKADSVIRFDYIKEKYGDKFIAADKITAAAGKIELDKVLLASRKYLKMTKDTTTTAKDVESYEKETLATLKVNEGFTKLEELYISNPLQFHKIMKSLPYFSYMIQQQKPEFYENYATVKANMEYVVEYYNYKTFGLLPSDIPDVAIEADKVDYTLMENFFLNYTIKPKGFTKAELEDAFSNNQIDIMTPDMIESEENVSQSLGQNILYRVAKEVLGGYCGDNTLDDLKVFYSPDQKEKTGIYYEDGKWMVNQTRSNWGIFSYQDKEFATDEQLNDITKIGVLATLIATFTQDNDIDGNLIDTDTGTAEGKINKEYGSLMNTIIIEELGYRKPENVAKYKAEALAYIKENSDDTYIPLNIDLITKLTKAGIYNTGYYYYKRDGAKLIALEAVSAVIPSFLVSKTCGLTENIETYTVKEVVYSTDIKEQVATIDALIAKLSTTIVLDDSDLDVHEDIKKMILAKGTKRAELKLSLSHMEQTKAKEILDAQYDTFKMFFDNVYMMILHCASSGSSNDVDTYEDYLSISSYSTSSLLTFTTDTGTTKVAVAIPEFDYTDEFNSAILTYVLPDKKKTVADLLNSKETTDVDLGKLYAQEVLKSILESSIMHYDDTGATVEGVSSYGSRGVDEALLAKRLAINVKNVKETPVTKVDDTKVDKTKVVAAPEVDKTSPEAKAYKAEKVAEVKKSLDIESDDAK